MRPKETKRTASAQNPPSVPPPSTGWTALPAEILLKICNQYLLEEGDLDSPGQLDTTAKRQRKNRRSYLLLVSRTCKSWCPAVRDALRLCVILSGPKDPWLDPTVVPNFAYGLVKTLDAKPLSRKKNAPVVPPAELKAFVDRLVRLRSISTNVYALCGPSRRNNLQLVSDNAAVEEVVVSNETCIYLSDHLPHARVLKWFGPLPNIDLIESTRNNAPNFKDLDLSLCVFDLGTSTDSVRAKVWELFSSLPALEGRLTLNTALTHVIAQIGNLPVVIASKFSSIAYPNGYMDISDEFAYGPDPLVHFHGDMKRLKPFIPFLTCTALRVLNAWMHPDDLYSFLNAGPFGTLTVVELESAVVSDNVLSAIGGNCPKLQRLQAWTGATDAGITSVAVGCRGLVELDVTGSFEVTDNALESVGEYLDKLELLSVGMCPKVSDRGVKAISMGCPRLQELELDQTGVTDVGIGYLAAAGFGNGEDSDTDVDGVDNDSDTEIDDNVEEPVARRKPTASKANRSDAAVNVRGCPHLTFLSLCWCANIQGTSLPILAKNCPNLHHLRTAMSSISNDTFYTSLPTFPSLALANLHYHGSTRAKTYLRTLKTTLTSEPVSTATHRTFSPRRIDTKYTLTPHQWTQFGMNRIASVLIDDVTSNPDPDSSAFLDGTLHRTKFRHRHTGDEYVLLDAGLFGDRGTGSLYR
ncbi:hypothetical protein HK104_004028, partial [Borealophlyctis nickersoniae]